jgi:hypothetical protein
MWRHWTWWIGSTLGTAVLLFFAWRGCMIPSWILVTVAIVGLFVAFFRTWWDEHMRANRNESSAKDRLNKIQQDWLKSGKNRKFKGPPQ